MKPFDALVTNAFDFLHRSIDEVESMPHYSILHFAIALELLLKARLVQEHWTLIFQDPGRADRSELDTGSFHSVSISEAIERIERILGERFGEAQKKAFQQVRDHRNRLVHAFHPRFSGTISPDVVQKAVAEQSLVWYYLSGLLRKKWSVAFSGYSTQVQELEEELQTKGHLLRGRYEDLRPAIQTQIEAGTTFHTCPVCSFESAREKAINGELVELQCVVCSDLRNVLKLVCQACDGVVLFEDLEGVCQDPECGATVDVEEVIDTFMLGGDKDDWSLGLPAICDFCEHVPASVVPWGDEFLCIACLEPHEFVTYCGYCNTAMTGDTEGTYAFGCTFCGGSIGADRS